MKHGARLRLGSMLCWDTVGNTKSRTVLELSLVWRLTDIGDNLLCLAEGPSDQEGLHSFGGPVQHMGSHLGVRRVA